MCPQKNAQMFNIFPADHENMIICNFSFKASYAVPCHHSLPLEGSHIVIKDRDCLPHSGIRGHCFITVEILLTFTTEDLVQHKHKPNRCSKYCIYCIYCYAHNHYSYKSHTPLTNNISTSLTIYLKKRQEMSL